MMSRDFDIHYSEKEKRYIQPWLIKGWLVAHQMSELLSCLKSYIETQK